MRWQVACLWLALIAGCNNEETPSGTSASGGSGSGSAAGKAATAGGGFSADLAKELAAATGSGAAQAGDGSAAAMAGSGDGSARAGDGSAKAGDGSAAAMAGSGSGSASAAGDGSAAKAGDGSAAKVAAGSGSSAKAPDPAPKVGTGPGPLIQASGVTPKRVAVPAELAAIKLSLLPNWERDVQDAGTLSLGVKIPGRSESAVFVFRYGYEDPSAPADRDAYKKWLADKKLLTVRQDRQAGAAWFLEGNDGRGGPAFRVVVNWGGKKLICYGSLYKDGESSKLGDLRDQTIIQAKQICETVAL